MNDRTKTPSLEDTSFDAQRYAHYVLRRVSKPSDGLVFSGVRSPNKVAAHLQITAEADMCGIPLNHKRVSLARMWVDMSSGVAV